MLVANAQNNSRVLLANYKMLQSMHQRLLDDATLSPSKTSCHPRALAGWRPWPRCLFAPPEQTEQVAREKAAQIADLVSYLHFSQPRLLNPSTIANSEQGRRQRRRRLR